MPAIGRAASNRTLATSFRQPSSTPTEEMVSAANRQMAEMHAMPEIPMPYSPVYHTWNEDPYGGGWHEWKANYRLDEIMCRMRKPVDDQDIFIVGEAYSYGQGWVEGALDTAESMLEDYFGLQKTVMDQRSGLCADAESLPRMRRRYRVH